MNPASTPASPDPGGAAPPGHHILSAEEKAEYERLRRAAKVRHRGLRRTGASVLLLLTLVLAPLAVVAAWVQATVSDTDRYVATVAPLASDPAVQDVVINRLTDRVVENVDVQAVTDSLTKVLKDAGAPPRVVAGADSLTGPLRSAVRSVVDRAVTRVITSDAFQQVWEGANRRSHAAVVNMLTGDSKGAVRAQGDTISLNVGDVVDQVKKRLVDAGFEKASAIPDTDKTVTLFHTEKLAKAQDAMRLLDILGTWLPVLTIAMAALTVWTAPSHRLMLMITAIGIGVMMVVVLVALAVLRRVYLDSVPPSALPPDAAAAIYDTFIRFLRNSTRTLLIIAVITALAAYLYGPSRVARAVRSTADRGTTAAGRALGHTRVRTEPVSHWLAEHRRWTTGIVIAAGGLWLLLWNYPTVASVALVLCVVLAALILLAILAAAGPADGTEAEAEHGAPNRATP